MRPIIDIHSTNSPDQILTPGHFLIGCPLTAPPTKQASQAKLPALRRWQLVQRLAQDIWVTWKSTYLQQLNAREKWKTGNHEFRIGDLVFLKDNSFAYRRWLLARISAIYPGDDDITRVVDITCKGKTWRRAVHHLIPFIQQEHELDSSNSPKDNHLEECSDDSSSRTPSPVCSGHTT